MATMWNPSSWLRMAAKNPPEDQLTQQQAEEQAALPFLLMGNQAAGPQMSFAQPFDQGMTAVAPQPVMPTVQPIVPESEPVAPPPPTQQDMSAAAVGQPPAEEDYLAGFSPEAREFLKNYQESISAQKEQLGLAEKRLLEAQQAKGQINLAPLARLVDVWTGSNLASAYTSPEPKEKIVQQLQDAVLKARGDLSQSARDIFLKTLAIRKEQETAQDTKEERAIRRAELGLEKEKTRGLQEEKFQEEVEKNYSKEFGENMRGLTDLADKSVRLKKILDEKGDIWQGKTAAQIDSLSSSIATLYNRDVAKLGALAGADLKLINRASNQGMDIEDYITRQLKGGAEGRRAVLEMMIEDMKETAARTENTVKAKASYPRLEKMFQNDYAAFNKAMYGSSSSKASQGGYSKEQLEQEIARRQNLQKQAGGQ